MVKPPYRVCVESILAIQFGIEWLTDAPRFLGYIKDVGRMGMQKHKIKRKSSYFASAFAGAYFLFSALGFVAMTRGDVRQVKGEEHARETLCAYTTYFNQNEQGRCENIRLAAARLDGIALQPYGEFSFNGTVGARTEENGYRPAKVIVSGEFVDGVGGGVCQVSTTLYNAALLSGLIATEYHAHSMRVGYVPPSRDAMVTEFSDLKLYNPHSETVYISSQVGAGWLRFTLRGKATETEYSIESRSLGEIPPPEPLIEAGERDEIIRFGQAGMRSEAYLKTYEKGVLVSVRRLRSDEYAPQRGVIRKKS